MNNYKTIEKFPITGDNKSIVYLDLGLMPLVNNLNNTKEESLNCSKYSSCALMILQISASISVDKNIILCSINFEKTSTTIPPGFSSIICNVLF